MKDPHPELTLSAYATLDGILTALCSTIPPTAVATALGVFLVQLRRHRPDSYRLLQCADACAMRATDDTYGALADALYAGEPVDEGLH